MNNQMNQNKMNNISLAFNVLIPDAYIADDNYIEENNNNNTGLKECKVTPTTIISSSEA